MKKLFYYTLLATGLLFSGVACDKYEGPGRGQDLVFRQTFEIPAGIGVFDVHHFYITNIPTNYESTLSRAGLKDSDIIRVTTLESSILGLFGDANFDFIDRISIRAFETDPNNYLEIAYRDPAPVDPGNNMGLIPSLADAKDFFNNDRVSLDIVVWLRKTTPTSTPVQFDLTMRAEY